MAKKFMSSAHFLSFLREQGVADILHVNQNEEFLAECVFLNDWNEKLQHKPELEGLDEFFANSLDIKYGAYSVYVIISYGNDNIFIVYTTDPDNPGRHALEINYNGSVVYARTANQNPATEWEINIMANNVKDEQGNFYFIGEPINI